MAGVTAVSQEFTNRSQSWCFTGIYRTGYAMYEVDIRANAYDEQSWAKLSVWSGTEKGWKHFVSLPTERWYPNAPSYTRKELTPEDKAMFIEVRDILLGKLGKGLWDDPHVEVYGEGV